MTEIGQSVFELYERKENVGRWRSVCRLGKHTLALLWALSLTTAPWLRHQRVIRVTQANMLLPKHFFSVAHRFGAIGRNILQWPTDNHHKATRRLNKTNIWQGLITFCGEGFYTKRYKYLSVSFNVVSSVLRCSFVCLFDTKWAGSITQERFDLDSPNFMGTTILPFSAELLGRTSLASSNVKW